MQFVLHVSYSIFLFFYFSLFAAICSFVFLWLCCCHALAWWLRLPTISHRKALQKENIQRGVVYNICAPQRLNRNGGRQKTPYLACTESLRLGEVVAKGKRKAFIKVSTRKTPTIHSLLLSQNQCSKIPQSQILLHPINYSTCLFCTTTPVYKDCLANCKCLRARWAPITSQPHVDYIVI